MPLIYQHQINENSRLGVWHITEAEGFFLERVPLQRSITHPHKRLQHLAGRCLLTELVPDFPHDLIRIADTRKPFLANEAWHFSLSHCGDYAAAIVSSTQRVGVDVELVSDKVARVQHKFLTKEELDLVANTEYPILSTDDRGSMTEGQMRNDESRMTNDEQETTNTELRSTVNGQRSTIALLTACWSIKEALFKWQGTGEMDFRQHLRIEQLMIKDNEGRASCRILKDGDIPLTVQLLFFNGVWLSWVIS